MLGRNGPHNGPSFSQLVELKASSVVFVNLILH